MSRTEKNESKEELVVLSLVG